MIRYVVSDAPVSYSHSWKLEHDESTYANGLDFIHAARSHGGREKHITYKEGHA
jgi:hypothetical protein